IDRAQYLRRLRGAARERRALLLQGPPSVEARVVERAADLLERQAQLAADQYLLQPQQIVVGVEPIARRGPTARSEQADRVVVVQRGTRHAALVRDFLHLIMTS